MIDVSTQRLANVAEHKVEFSLLANLCTAMLICLHKTGSIGNLEHPVYV